jgi:hypothetical protein
VLPGYFVYIAAVVGILGITGYVRDTLSGKTFPHRITWFLWGFIPLVTFFVQIHVGVGIQTIMTFSYFIAPMIVVTASFVARRGSWAITPFDWACGAMCLVGIAVYLVTLRGNLAIGVLLLADVFAAVPTIRKSYGAPESETWTAYLVGALTSVITLLTITHWTFATYALPAWIAFQNSMEIVLIRGRLGPRLRARSAAAIEA